MNANMKASSHAPHGVSPFFMGGGLFLVSAPVHLSVEQDVSILISALTLALIGGAYIGFAAQHISQKVFWGELAVAIGFALAALAGVMWWPAMIGLGLIAHAVWDILHHNRKFGADVPSWYISLCAVFDIAAGLFLLLLYGL